jgi:hypothetical protein
VALAHELFLKRERQLVIQLVETVLGIDLSFVCQVDELGLELMEGLNLVHSQLLVFTSSFAYAVRVDEVFTEVVDYSKVTALPGKALEYPTGRARL